jgi:hypothetical protein
MKDIVACNRVELSVIKRQIDCAGPLKNDSFPHTFDPGVSFADLS